LRGAVRIEVLTDRPADRFRPGAVLHVEGSAEPLTVTSGTPVADGPGWRMTFREVPDRTAAERLRGAYLEADVDASAEREPGEHYWHEVIGAAVRGIDGEILGRVEDIYRVAETEVLVVRGGPAGEFDLPVVQALIRVFDPRGGDIVVDASALGLDAGPRTRHATETASTPAAETAADAGLRQRRRSAPRRATTDEPGQPPGT
jgi:16S rRNA processing protein RimM